jgi:hypothetical protein
MILTKCPVRPAKNEAKNESGRSRSWPSPPSPLSARPPSRRQRPTPKSPTSPWAPTPWSPPSSSPQPRPTCSTRPQPSPSTPALTAPRPTQAGEKTVPAQYQIEKFGTPWYTCASTVPPASPQTRLRGCEALDRTSLTIRDPNTIAWQISTHGPAVQLSVNLEVHDILPFSQGSPETPWKARDVIFVAVPKATPAYRFSSEVLVGEWNGEAIVFEVGKDLPEPAKKALEDLGIKQDLGDRVLYSFRVKEPEKKDEKKP